MYCTNCGSKLKDGAYVCLNCGVLVNKEDNIQKKEKPIKIKKDTKIIGILSMVFGVFALAFSVLLYFHDISSVGMYTEVWERIGFTLGYSLFAILFFAFSFVLALVSKKNVYSNAGLCLSLFSFFLIVAEFIVVIAY